MLRALFETNDSWVATVLRLALGIVMFPHGAQKALGWFGGYGFTGTMGYFTGMVGLPWIIGALVIVIEFCGSIALILGAGARLAAAGVIAVMIGAVATTHYKIGFFMNWGGNQAGEGFEYHILAVALGAGVVLMGAGRASLDRLIGVRLSGMEEPDPPSARQTLDFQAARRY